MQLILIRVVLSITKYFLHYLFNSTNINIEFLMVLLVTCQYPIAIRLNQIKSVETLTIQAV